MNVNYFRIVLATIALSLTWPASVSADCLTDVSDFAERICGEIWRVGSRSVVEVDGTLNAELGKLLRKFAGDIEAGGGAKYVEETYTNVLRSDLYNDIKDTRECRERMATVGIEKICGRPTAEIRQQFVFDLFNKTYELSGPADQVNAVRTILNDAEAKIERMFVHIAAAKKQNRPLSVDEKSLSKKILVEMPAIDQKLQSKYPSVKGGREALMSMSSAFWTALSLVK